MDNHPIIPTSELIKQLETAYFDHGENFDVLMIQAYQAGADKELEACCEWVWSKLGSLDLHNARRPKPPSLKEQALAKLPEHPEDMTSSQYWELTPSEVTIIRRALEQLPDE